MPTRTPQLAHALSIAERLKITRSALGLTQKGIATPLSVTREAYTQWETGAREPSWQMAVELCEAYDLSLDWIYRGDMTRLPPGLQDKIRDRLVVVRVKIV